MAIVHPLEIYYFTGVLLPEIFPAQPALLWIEAGGDSFLAADSDAGEPVVDECVTYVSSLGGTMNSYMRTQLSELVSDRLQVKGAQASRVGFQREFMVKMLGDHIEKGLGSAPEWVDMMRHCMRCRK